MAAGSPDRSDARAWPAVQQLRPLAASSAPSTTPAPGLIRADDNFPPRLAQHDRGSLRIPPPIERWASRAASSHNVDALGQRYDPRIHAHRERHVRQRTSTVQDDLPRIGTNAVDDEIGCATGPRFELWKSSGRHPYLARLWRIRIERTVPSDIGAVHCLT